MSYKKSNNIATWAIIGFIAMLGLNAYLWYENSQLKSVKAKQELETIELQKIQADLDQAYQESLESLEDMRNDNKELNDLIESQKRELLAQKDKINNLIWTKRELSKAKEEIQVLNNQAAGFVAEIARLKEENGQLSSSNTRLRSENNVLSQQVTAEIEEKNTIAKAKAALEVEHKEISSKNKKLSSKVDMANAIKINFIEVQGYKVTKSGKRKKRRRAKNIKLLETCFTTETNLVTSAGEKTFYVRIIDPLGETVVIDEINSGAITNKLDGSQVRYTTSGIMDYKNEDTNGCISWEVYNPLQKGEYEVIIYNNGYPVGQGKFKLK